MRHGSAHRKLNRTAEHRKPMFANMSAALIKPDQITTPRRDLSSSVERERRRTGPFSWVLERDDFSSNRHPAPAYSRSMIFSENRCPLFGIMLYRIVIGARHDIRRAAARLRFLSLPLV